MKIAALTTALVTLVVTVIIIALVAVPVIDDSTKGTPYTSENANWDARYTLLENPTFTYTFQSGVTTIAYDGKTETIPVQAEIPTILCSEISIRTRETGVTYYDTGNSMWSSVTTDSGSVLSIVVEDGSYTITRAGTVTGTGTMDSCFVRSATGEYGVFSGSSKVTLHDTYYVGSFFDITNNGPMRLYSVTDGTLGTAVVEPFSAASVEGNHVIVNGWTVTGDVSYDVIGGNQAVGMVDGVAWTWTDGSTSGSGTVTYTIAAIEYSSTPLGTGDDTNSILLSVIPVMLIIVAIMVAVRIIRDA